MEVKAKISETEAETKEASEAIKKLVAKGLPLSSEDKDTLAYLRQKETALLQKETALLQEKTALLQKESDLRRDRTTEASNIFRKSLLHLL